MNKNRKKNRKKNRETESTAEAKLKGFLDMIAPSVIQFYTDHYICGNTYRSVWALREYPTATDEQAILRHLGEKDGVTLRIYTRQVTPAEEKKIISNAANKNRMKQGNTENLQETVTAASNLQDVTAIISNNYNYGQTGGQYSATTPTHSITQTSPYGHVEQAFDICQLAIAAGASYVGRATAYNPLMIRKLIKEGMQVKGFSLIEVMSACPTHYGKFNKLGEASRMLKLMNEQSVTVSQAAKLSPEELKGKLVVGCLKNEPRDDYYTEYARIIEAQKVED